MKKAEGGVAIAVIIIVVIVIVLVVALWGGWMDFSVKADTAFRGGPQALELSFIGLPAQVNQNQPFDIVVLAQNKGEYAIPKDKVRAVLNNAQTFDIQKAAQTNLEIVRSVEDGGEVEFTYLNAKYLGTVLSEEIPQTLSVGVCYPYKTYVLVKDVCLAPSNTNELCEYIGEKAVENSGSPVHLNSFKQLSSVYNSGSEYVDLTIKLEFESHGDIYSPDAACNSVSASDINIFKITSMKLGTQDIKPISEHCKTNIISLSEKDGRTTGSLRCTIRQPNIRTDAVGILTMELEYLHNQQLKDSITVMPS